LAGCPADEDVDGWLIVNSVSCVDEIGKVSMVLDLRVVMREDRAGERLDLTEPRRLPA